MMYDRMESSGFIREKLTGLEPYYGRPTPGNDVIDGYMEKNKDSIDDIAEAVSDMNRAVQLAERTHFSAEQCIEAVYSRLNCHFLTQGKWNCEEAKSVVANFDGDGFRPKRVREFVSFIRGMFFDDAAPVFQAINCIGLSSTEYGSFTLAGGTFEDSASGNQFAVMMPFTVENRTGWRTSFDVNLREVPCYMLEAPDQEGMSCTVAKSYDIREIRVAVKKFVEGGSVYRRGAAVRTSYRWRGNGWMIGTYTG